MSFLFTMPPIPRYLHPNDRTAIEAQIEALIDLLDQEDGDPDIEEDDHAGGNVTDQPHDFHEDLLPRYGVDQSLGPINEASAKREWHRRQYGY